MATLEEPAAPRPPARILIADDHELARSGLRAMLEGEPDLVVVGEARDGLEAVELCTKHMPDLLLLDVRMPHLGGLGAAHAVKLACPEVRIVMVTMHESPEYLAESLRAGASGYILKDASRRHLLAALRSVLEGEICLNGALAASAIGKLDALKPASAELLEPLTPRETEVLGLVVQGLTNKEIARQLDISPGTVKVHVERLIGKLGVVDRTQAAVRALEQGLVAGAPR